MFITKVEQVFGVVDVKRLDLSELGAVTSDKTRPVTSAATLADAVSFETLRDVVIELKLQIETSRARRAGCVACQRHVH